MSTSGVITLSPELTKLKCTLIDLGQAFLFSPISASTSGEGANKLAAQDVRLLEELDDIRNTYPGGVVAYVKSAKALLSDGGASGEEIVDISSPPESLIQHAPNLCVDAAKSPEEFERLLQLEEVGHRLLKDTIFVLVAGGLGERLGYPSIKVGLPIETATFRTYLEHYFTWFAKVGRQGMSVPPPKANGAPTSMSPTPLFCYPHEDCLTHGGSLAMPTITIPMNPIVIMTSNDTHDLTLKLLEDSKYFGYDPARVFLVKQATVPCVTNSNGDLAVETCEDGSKRLVRKPHGHGDVHQLMYLLRTADGSASLLETLLEGSSAEHCGIAGGYQYVTFMQDTNAFAPMTLPVTLAHCDLAKMDMNFGCVPRSPGEAIGVFCQQRIRRVAADGTESFFSRCGNVEYNLFFPTLQRVTGASSEPTLPADEKGTAYSPYPGSINTLVVRLDRYVASLRESRGAVPEFINPKYKDPVKKTDFKSPARVESLMQDICFNLKSAAGVETEGLIARVGCSVFNRNTYEPVKNALADGIDVFLNKRIAACTAATGEAQVLHMLRQRLVAATGVSIEAASHAQDVTVASPVNPSQTISVRLFPIISYDARFASSAAELRARFPNPERVRISSRSSLVVLGNVTIHSLDLDGSLVIDATGQRPSGTLGSGGHSCRGTSSIHIDVRDLRVTNAGWKPVTVSAIESDGVVPINVINRPHVLATTSTKSDTFSLLDVDRVRGYVLSRDETMVHTFTEPGNFTLTGAESDCYVIFNRPSSL